MSELFLKFIEYAENGGMEEAPIEFKGLFLHVYLHGAIDAMGVVIDKLGEDLTVEAAIDAMFGCAEEAMSVLTHAYTKGADKNNPVTRFMERMVSPPRSTQ